VPDGDFPHPPEPSALLAAASVSVAPGRTFQLVDVGGAGLDPSYIAYSYVGHRLNFVHPVSYRASRLALARSDAAGSVSVPPAVHPHLPFPLQTHPALRVEMVYAPRMHNAWGQLSEGSPSVPGIFEIDAGRRRAVVADLSGRPEEWEGSLRNLSSMIHQLMSARPGEPPLREADPASAALVRELLGHFREEYRAFLERYDEVARPWPEMPVWARSSSAEEQRSWRTTIEKHLALEPRWGILIRRLFGTESKVFAQWESELAR
jgi:hypothetical protein